MRSATVVGATALGAIAGAVLPVAAYRLSVPWRKPGEPPVAPRGTCRHCDAPLPSGVRGWLRFGSACPACHQRMGQPAFVPAALCGLGCAGIAWRFGTSAELLPYCLLVVFGVLIAMVDVAAQRIPDVLVLPGAGATVVLFAVLAAVTGDWGSFGRVLAAGVALFAGYAVLALLPGAQVGGGDVALAFVLGGFLGWLGWPFVLAGVLLPWLIQAPVALVALATRRAGRDTMLPFGPAMLLGTYFAILAPAVLSARG